MCAHPYKKAKIKQKERERRRRKTYPLTNIYNIYIIPTPVVPKIRFGLTE